MLWPTLADLTMSVPSHEGALDDWLLSWTRAQEVGMGGEFSLPAGCTPETIAALYVYGIGEDHPAELFRSHADAGILGFLRLAAATNSVQGAPAADLAGDADTWRSIALQRLAGALAPLDIAAALSGDKGELPSVPGGSGDAAEGGRLVRGALARAARALFSRPLEMRGGCRQAWALGGQMARSRGAFCAAADRGAALWPTSRDRAAALGAPRR